MQTSAPSRPGWPRAPCRPTRTRNPPGASSRPCVAAYWEADPMKTALQIAALLLALTACRSALARDALTEGQYLTTIGDCASCHTARNGKPMAGGRVVPTPFGAIPSPNLTPDHETGLGTWSAEDFYQALHSGKAHDGTSLYPAFPFTSYTKVTRADSDAMFAYLKSLPAVRNPDTPNTLRWPYRMRSLMATWRLMYFDEGEYQPD